MEVEFRASERSSLGVEIELQLVDAETGELVGAAPEVLAELSAQHGGEEHPRIKAELYQCTLEVITGICDTVADARADLEEGVAEIRAIAEPRGVDLVSAGLHPFTPWQSQERSVGERYDAIVERIQWPAKRLITHGVHYHVGVRSAEKSIQITNALATMLPVFLALSTSSPFWHGDDTGLESARTKVFESLPSTGLPPNLADWAEFERFMTSLINAGAMTTIREVWWDIRPHPNFGTVELRMCDAMPTMTETCALAALAQCAVARYDELLDRGYRLPSERDWVLRENKWRAARHGLDASMVVDSSGRTRPITNLIEEAVEELMPFARRLDCADELDGIHAILSTGTSARRQREVLDQHGDLRDVVRALRAEFATDTPFAAVHVRGVRRVTTVRRIVASHEHELVALRRLLHAQPEPSGAEHVTTEVIVERLSVEGLRPTVFAMGTGRGVRHLAGPRPRAGPIVDAHGRPACRHRRPRDGRPHRGSVPVEDSGDGPCVRSRRAHRRGARRRAGPAPVAAHAPPRRRRPADLRARRGGRARRCRRGHR